MLVAQVLALPARLAKPQLFILSLMTRAQARVIFMCGPFRRALVFDRMHFPPKRVTNG